MVLIKKNLRIFNLNVTSVLLRKLRTSLLWSVCSSGVFENTMMSCRFTRADYHLAVGSIESNGF